MYFYIRVYAVDLLFNQNFSFCIFLFSSYIFLFSFQDGTSIIIGIEMQRKGMEIKKRMLLESLFDKTFCFLQFTIKYLKLSKLSHTYFTSFFTSNI